MSRNKLGRVKKTILFFTNGLDFRSFDFTFRDTGGMFSIILPPHIIYRFTQTISPEYRDIRDLTRVSGIRPKIKLCDYLEKLKIYVNFVSFDDCKCNT